MLDNNEHKLFFGPDSKFYWDKVTLAILLESKYKSTPAQYFETQMILDNS
jgi:hypothetical protein